MLIGNPGCRRTGIEKLVVNRAISGEHNTAFYRRQWGARYGLAVIAVAAGLLLRWALVARVGEDLPTYITFYPAVVTTVLLAGLGPGLLASALSVLVVDWYIICPGQFFFRTRLAETVGAVLFSVMAVSLCALTEHYRVTRDRAAAYEKDLIVRESQEEVHRAKEQWERTFDAVPDLITILDGQHRVLRANRAMRERLGISPGQYLGATCPGLMDGTDCQTNVCPEVLKLADGRENASEIHEPRLGGDFLVTTTPLANEKGQHLGVVHVARDISVRKRAEEALARANERLEREVLERTAELRKTIEALESEIRMRKETEQRITEAEFRYRTVANFTHDWEYWRDPQGALLYCSPSCLRITGWTAEELSATPALLSQMVHLDDLQSWKQHERDSLATRHSLSLQFRIVRKDGVIRWIEHACVAVFGPAGQYWGVRAGNRDITDRKHTDMVMQQLRQELAQASRITMAGQLAAAIAHELNQPLGAILCNAQSAEKLLNRQNPDLVEALNTLKDIRTDSQRAGAVIHRLRALYQNAAKDRSRLLLNEVVRETIALLNSEFALRGVTVRLDLDPGVPHVLGNATELQQVFVNLILNALEAMVSCPPGKRHLDLATADAGDWVSFSITDSGPGIAPENLHLLFKPFFSSKSKGMGMGLAICQTIIEAHGGRLSAHHDPAGGAIFRFTLPKICEASHEPDARHSVSC